MPSNMAIESTLSPYHSTDEGVRPKPALHTFMQELLIYTMHKGLPKMQLKRRPFLLQKFGASRREIQK